jgi:hypothetical protein
MNSLMEFMWKNIIINYGSKGGIEDTIVMDYTF